MKQKYIITVEDGYDKSTGLPKTKEIKSFKHAPEALDFINAQKNINMYGTMYLERHDGDGQTYDWNDHSRSWVQR